MQSDMKQQYNKYSIGKRFRKAKGMRTTDKTYSDVDPPEHLQSYINYLSINGVLINKVKYGLFRTKNGLPYPGLVATERILANESLVHVPREMLLTTRHAFFSPLQKVFMAHPQFYSAEFTSSHEDHMLLAFLLYQNQLGKESAWFHLLTNLPKDIDYLVFWDGEELLQLQDQSIVRTARKQRAEYEMECLTTQKILSLYPDLIKPEYITEPLIRWIYTHLVTRCFGKYLCYVTMVPFCELFNHECTDVFYDYLYEPHNPNKKDESEQMLPVELDQEEQDNATSSDGSYGSEDEVSDDEFLVKQDINTTPDNLYEQKMEDEKAQFMDKFMRESDIQQGDMNQQEYEQHINCLREKQINARKAFNIKQSLQKEVYLLASDIKIWMYSNIDYGDSFSIFFINQIYLKIQKSLEDYFSDKKAYFMVREDLKRLQQTAVIYKNEMYKYSKDILKKTIYSTSTFAQKRKPQNNHPQILSPEDTLAQETSSDTEYFAKPEDWPIDKFDQFVMKCGAKDQFEKNSQVFFCYGRLSNRMMLMRYGMALEYNKYDHLHLRVDYLQLMRKNSIETSEELMAKLMTYNISKYKRFKIKHTTFPIDLILFCKANKWQFNVHTLDSLFGISDLALEIQALEMGATILEDFLANNFKQSLQENEALLKDSSLGYHSHFASIYRTERQRILMFQVKLMKIAKEILQRIHSKGISFEIAGLRVHEFESAEDYNMHRLVLAKYFNMIKFNFYIKKQ